jgi:hypothetical protein
MTVFGDKILRNCFDPGIVSEIKMEYIIYVMYSFVIKLILSAILLYC